MSKRITIIGNSVSLRIRPPEQTNEHDNNVYGKILEDKHRNSRLELEVINYGQSRLLIKEIYDSKDKYITTSPDVFVFNIGCVDAPNREIPLWYSDIIFKRKYRILYRSFHFFYERLIKRYFRTPLVLFRGRKSWVSEQEFNFYFDDVLKEFINKTNAKIIILGINNGNERIEKVLPGTIKKYEQYSKVLQQLCFKYDLEYIDVSDMNSEIYFPDGVHYNLAGHKEIAKRLSNKILKIITIKNQSSI